MSISEKQKENVHDLAGKGELSGRDSFYVIFLDYLERTYYGEGLLTKREAQAIAKGLAGREDEILTYETFAGAISDIMLSLRECQVFGTTCLWLLEKEGSGHLQAIKSNYGKYLGTKAVMDELTKVVGIPFKELIELDQALQKAIQRHSSRAITKIKPHRKTEKLVQKRLAFPLGTEWWKYLPYKEASEVELYD